MCCYLSRRAAEELQDGALPVQQKLHQILFTICEEVKQHLHGLEMQLQLIADMCLNIDMKVPYHHLLLHEQVQSVDRVCDP